MKALTFNPPASGSGSPALEHIELPTPKPGPGEVLVQVHYAALNNFDLETTRGERNKAIAKAARRNPVVTGIEMAGVVRSDGAKLRRGDKVFGYTNIFKGPWFHAQYVAHREDRLARVPDDFTLEGATSVVGGALTAITALERIARLPAGANVLITGATGSVGSTAVQLATHLGAKVSAVCRSTQMDFAREQGAEEVYAYDRKELPPPRPAVRRGVRYRSVLVLPHRPALVETPRGLHPHHAAPRRLRLCSGAVFATQVGLFAGKGHRPRAHDPAAHVDGPGRVSTGDRQHPSPVSGR